MINWKDGTKISDARVNTDGTIQEAVYEGDTPLSAYNLNLMQRNDIKTLTLKKSTTIKNDYKVILPLKYQVGNNSLKVILSGEVLIKDTHYREIR